MSIYKVFDMDRQQYWCGFASDTDDRGKTFDTLTAVLDNLEYVRKGSSWSMHKPTPIPLSWIIVEYELKQVWTANAKEYAEAR